MGGVDLSTALAQNAPKVHALGLDSVLQLMIKLLGDGSRAHELEGRHTSTAMGQILACLATCTAGSTALGLRARAGQGVGLLAKRRDMGSVRAAHELLAGVFTNKKCPAPLRAALARAYRALLWDLARSVPEQQLVSYASYVLMLASPASLSGTTAATVGGGGRWVGAVMEDGRQVCACVATAMSGLIERLSESGKTLLVQVLLGEVAKRKMALLPPRAGGSGSAPVDLREAVPVTCALQALTTLYTDIGGCAPGRETWDLIASLACAPWTATRVAAAQCLASIGTKAPQYLLPSVQRSVEVLLTEASLANGYLAATLLQGTCLSVVTMTMTARIHSHGVPCVVLDSLMSVAKMMLKESARGSSDDGAEAESHMLESRLEGGWMLICVCLRAGAEWVAGYLPVILQVCFFSLSEIGLFCHMIGFFCHAIGLF